MQMLSIFEPTVYLFCFRPKINSKGQVFFFPKFDSIEESTHKFKYFFFFTLSRKNVSQKKNVWFLFQQPQAKT